MVGSNSLSGLLYQKFKDEILTQPKEFTAIIKNLASGPENLKAKIAFLEDVCELQDKGIRIMWEN
jgi:hypothetical protein